MLRKKIMLLIVMIGIVAISSFSIGYVAFILINNNIPKLPETIIASDDIMVVQYWVDNSTYGERVDNPEILREGYHISDGNWSTREFYRIWIQFRLPTILKNWSKCILQVHICNSVDDRKIGEYGFRIHANTTWDESMSITEFRDNCDNKVDWDFMDIDTVRSTGIITYDMSEYIENSKSITVNFYIQNAHLEHEDYFEDMYFEIYSKDSNVDKEYLPQLIWS